jgi:broad specificity phosphatase PhoE
MKLYLIRHARSIANELQLVTGTPSDTLSEQGILQAKNTAVWLQEAGFKGERYIVSHWNRARQTAEILFPDAQWETEPRLGETNAGEVAEWPLVAFKAHYADSMTDSFHAYPSGESHDALNQRVLAWLNDILNATCEHLVVVTHSGPITCLLQYATGLTMENFPVFLPHNASLSILDIERVAGQIKCQLHGFSLGPIPNFPATFHEIAQR